jgi:uncharacterized protein with von Willebrand factor type A (vWA) domain
MNVPLQPVAADAPYDQLGGLPRGVWLPTLTAAVGTPELRLPSVRGWRDALLQGELPRAADDFGDPEATAPLRQACGELDLPGLCHQRPAWVEQVLRTVLWHLDRLIDLQPRLTRTQAIAEAGQMFRDAWQQEKGDWEAMLAVLQDLADGAERHWDALRGQMRSRDWQEAERVSRALARMPEVTALIRRLGRAERASMHVAPAPQNQDTASRRQFGHRVVETRLPGLPGEWRGICLTDRLERQLGSEAAMLVHPVLHKLWRARRAEARLLGYDSEAVLHDLRPDPSCPPRADAAPPRHEALERGPMIVCLDTSGSMRGAPETVAKAVVLEAVRTAHRERRGCLLIAFGGHDEMIERELAATPQGLQALLAVMGQGFDGGTDVQGPIERAIDRVHDSRWCRADLLIVSDGEFGCVPETLARLDTAREQLGLRVQGVLVGDRETLGLMDVADDIHWVRDWRRYGPDGERPAFSPVHSQSLTALYFPNALSDRAARHRRT